jgi:O-methyltransferase involved in polyketide biosynthesis
LPPGSSGNQGAVTQQHPPHAAVALEGVSETTLWTLHHRASEAARPDRVLHDPMAVELVESIDFPFEDRFGTSSTWSQWQALRARTFDREVRRFLADHPDGTVIALGEGLETQLWRVNNNHVRWVSVDLPPSFAGSSCRRAHASSSSRRRSSTAPGSTRSTRQARS